MKFKNRRGQFAIIASFLTIIVLLSAINLSYNRIQNNQQSEPATILNPTQRINKAIDSLLAFSVSYYASIFNVTGDYSYAQKATRDYLSGGFNKLAHSEAESNPSFELNTTTFKINWYKKQSFSNGTIDLVYDLPNIGLKGLRYGYSASLKVNTLSMKNGTLLVRVYVDGLTDLSLTEDNFRFMIYNAQKRAWVFIYPTEIEIMTDGTYSILIPAEIGQKICFLEVRDNRGIIVKTIYLRDVNGGDDNPDFTNYKFKLDWNQTVYTSQMKNDYFPLEYLQNGTLRYLGQSLNKGNEKPVPQIPVRLLRVNQTMDSINKECRFQVEDWNADYLVPLGITSNNTLFSENNMIVFLVNHHVSDITIWWVDDDSANQTRYAIDNKYFNDDINSNVLVSNVRGSPFKLDFKQWNAPNYYFTTDYKGVIVDSYLGLTNSTSPVFPSGMTYVIYNGVVRDIVMQMAIVDTLDNSIPTIYYNYVIMLPANCTYYTYQITNTMLSTTRNRKVNDLSFLKIKITNNNLKYIMTDLDNNKMEVANPTTFPAQYKGINRWVEYMDYTHSIYKGAGILMMQESVDKIFKFDQDISPLSTGRVNLVSSDIQLSPVLLFPLTHYTQYSQVTWHGAVMSFSSNSPYDTIYYNDAGILKGLYSMVVYPPKVS